VSLTLHDRIEAIAGAIALGEANDDERREYREHIATCPKCLNALGGEHEIERVVSTVAAARESEIWQPDLRDVVASRVQRRNHRLRFGFGVAGLAVALSLGVHTLVASRATPLEMQPAQAEAPIAVTRVAFEQRSAVPPKTAPVLPQRRLIVQHNVVQVSRAPIASQAVAIAPASVPNAKPQDIATVTVHAPPRQAHKAQKSDVPVWRRQDSDTWHTVAQTTTTSISESAPQTLTHRAESIQVFSSHVAREAAPVGGETAINPQPPMIAYDEGAEGTTAFEVLVDERGNPTKCVITKSAGYAVLDNTVCRAAMQARYTPKTIDGRAVAGVYRDAFTFRMSQTDQNVEGIPKQIPQ
jgi:TonB family protein